MASTAKIDIIHATEYNPLSGEEYENVVDFLFKNLEKYGDPKEHIQLALDYTFSKDMGKGGFVLVAKINHQIVGAVVVNKTGMEKYIPENILVYIAVDDKMRGKGIGKKLMQRTAELANGAIALHVEPDNPARKLYEDLGFTSKYIEMRFENKKPNLN